MYKNVASAIVTDMKTHTARGLATSLIILIVAVVVAAIVGGAYLTQQTSTVSVQEAATTTPVVVTTKTTTTTKPAAPVAVSGMSKYTDTDLGVLFYAPANLMLQADTRQAGCLNLINPSDKGAGYPSNPGTWITICKKTASTYTETGYWGNKIYYAYDTGLNRWMYAEIGPGADDLGGESVATTTANITATTLTGEPIFVGTGAHSFSDRIVPLDSKTFLTVNEGIWGEDFAPDSFLDRFVQTFARVNGVVDTAKLQQALKNEQTAYSALGVN